MYAVRHVFRSACDNRQSDSHLVQSHLHEPVQTVETCVSQSVWYEPSSDRTGALHEQLLASFPVFKVKTRRP